MNKRIEALRVLFRGLSNANPYQIQLCPTCLIRVEHCQCTGVQDDAEEPILLVAR